MLSLTIESQGVKLCLLFIQEELTNTQFLFHTGAEISVIPHTPQEKRFIAKIKLFADNGTQIKTYGQKLLKLDFELRRAHNRPIVIVDVTKPMIGIDFLAQFNLLVDSKNRKAMDGITSLSAVGNSYHNIDPHTLNAINHNKACLECQKSKAQRRTHSVISSSTASPERFHHIHINIVGRLPTCQGFRYLQMMIDRFSELIEVLPMTDQ
ncbi:transposon Ty3-I Gag-Pol polyprotein [Trichonephila clavipes]|nr:transposon Ty3-I Gag-Pol polyprotein [Trichonephila clavipes]